MNDSNVTPDENASEALVVPEDAVIVEGSHTGEVVVEPIDDTVMEPAAADARTADAQAADAPATGAHAAEAADAPDTVHSAAPVHHTGEVAYAPVQTVYVTAPTPPRPKGNRGMGALLAILATLAFAFVYAAVAALLILFVNPDGVASAVGTFIANPLFYVPVLVFLVMMILWALLANRASWWSWVIGSLVIAVVTYFASIGVLLLLAGGFGLTAREGAAIFVGLAVNPVVIAAALVARECAIWFGAAIAKRGRKVRERNYAAWQTFETEEAQKRAEFSGVAAN